MHIVDKNKKLREVESLLYECLLETSWLKNTTSTEDLNKLYIKNLRKASNILHELGGDFIQSFKYKTKIDNAAKTLRVCKNYSDEDLIVIIKTVYNAVNNIQTELQEIIFKLEKDMKDHVHF